ncbi:alpha 1,2-mannosyltransferase 2.4.1 [Tulasnella sp. UAMH 9824]|nr:alpha 1,2-mannosyltransferase 2.4.1 [Tulasnella sp. UAMH 9824]
MGNAKRPKWSILTYVLPVRTRFIERHHIGGGSEPFSLAIFAYIVLLSLIGFYYLLTISREEREYLHALRDKLACPDSHVIIDLDSHRDAPLKNLTQPRKANAAFVILARNQDLNGVLDSIQQNEDRFNKKFGYPYVFLNDEPYEPDFIKYTSEVISTTAEYGVIPHDHWHQPKWIDEDRATAARKKLEAQDVMYADSVPYRNMCRFNSGFFFRHELLKKYDYYWRIEPDIKFFCDLDFDPFLFMQDNKKVYGFTIALHEYLETIETLWNTTKEFIQKYPQHIPKGNALRFLSEDGGATYNGCHFWSNFEIADLNFWRSPAYMDFFNHLDQAGGFYYERWGDAPVHSIGAALLARPDQIHFFK